MPGQAKTVSVRIAPPNSLPGLKARQRDDRQQALRRIWRRWISATAQPLGAGGFDEIQSAHLQHRCARHAHVDRHEEQAQRQRGQDQSAWPRPAHAPSRYSPRRWSNTEAGQPAQPDRKAPAQPSAPPRKGASRKTAARGSSDRRVAPAALTGRGSDTERRRPAPATAQRPRQVRSSVAGRRSPISSATGICWRKE